MAISDYITCCKCGVKLIYDGNREQRDWWEQRWNKEPEIECPDCKTEQAQQVAAAWAEGYRQGVADERTSEANIGIAGFNAKVEPARQNPYGNTAPPQRQPLTDEEIDQLLPEIVSGGTFTVITYGRAVARAIEAAHGIKEKNT